MVLGIDSTFSYQLSIFILYKIRKYPGNTIDTVCNENKMEEPM